jgi:steroid delta-isomerase-like uncharacterized protein
MKSHAVCIAALILATACGPKPDQAVNKPTPSVAPTTAPEPAEPAPAPGPKLSLEERLAKHGAERAAAWESKDTAKINALYTADAVIVTPGTEGWKEQKPADLDAFHKDFWAGFPDAKSAATRILAQGDIVVVEWTVAGTNTGPFMGQKETGKKVGYRGASVVWLDGAGKVKREHVYVDMGTLMSQLGKGAKGEPFRAAEALPTAPPEVVIAAEGQADHKALFTQLNELATKKDHKGSAALMTDDAVFSGLYMPKDDKGKKAIEKSMAEGGKAFADDKYEVKNCVSAGDYVACETVWTATWKNAMGPMKATGKTGTVHGVDILKIKDGKVSRWNAYGNGLEFATSFGLM